MIKPKLTICFIGTAESIHMLKWAKYFSDQGHRVHLISYLVPVAQYDIAGINLHLINRTFPIRMWPFNTLLNLPITLIKVKKLIKEIKPDVIHAHYVTSYGTLASLLGFHPLVTTAWGSDILITPQKFLPSKWGVKYALRKADLITCDAEHMKEAMERFGAASDKIKVINFGIDTKRFSPGEKDQKLKEKIGLSGYKIVISLRNLEPVYDIETLIKAIPTILKQIPKTKFILFGRGSQEEEFKKLSEQLGVKDSIQFLGWASNEELPKYLRTADVYVSTSLSDGGIASSTAEAMACGLPVVITDVADNKRWVEDGGNGFLIPTKDSRLLAQKIIYLLRNENIRRKFGDRNRRIIEERNDYYKEMAKMEEIYLNLIKRK